MTPTTMTVTVHIKTERVLNGTRYPSASAVAKLGGTAELSLSFPGTPEEVAPIIQDILTTRMESLIEQALASVKQDAVRASGEIDTAHAPTLAAGTATLLAEDAK